MPERTPAQHGATQCSAGRELEREGGFGRLYKAYMALFQELQFSLESLFLLHKLLAVSLLQFLDMNGLWEVVATVRNQAQSQATA